MWRREAGCGDTWSNGKQDAQKTVINKGEQCGWPQPEGFQDKNTAEWASASGFIIVGLLASRAEERWE